MNARIETAVVRTQPGAPLDRANPQERWRQATTFPFQSGRTCRDGRSENHRWTGGRSPAVGQAAKQPVDALLVPLGRAQHRSFGNGRPKPLAGR